MEVDPHTIPALEPPDGLVSNFNDPTTIHPVLNIIGAVCLALCIPAITLRTFARVYIVKKFDINDGVLLWSVALMIVYVPLCMYTGHYGQGKHQWNVPLANFVELLKIFNVLEVLYSPMMFPAKYVVLRQIDTIFFQHRRDSLRRNGLLALIWINFFFYASVMISFICACIPREKIWNPWLPGRCIDTNAIQVASSAINILSDITILVLPLVALWGIQMPFRSKFGVIAIFSMGIFANIASIIRFYYTLRLIKSDDITIVIEPFAYWTQIEYTTVIIVACAPLFPVSFKHLIQKGKQLSPLRNTGRSTTIELQRVSRGEHSNAADRVYMGQDRRLESRDSDLGVV